jgi:hypothetical protein
MLFPGLGEWLVVSGQVFWRRFVATDLFHLDIQAV